MNVTRITDHVDQALARLIQQYKEKPNLAALITAFVDQIQDLEDAIFDLDEGRQFFNGTTYPAVGDQLDGIGALVGARRNGLDDATYLIFIIGTIAQNFSDTTIPTMITIVENFFQPETVIPRSAPPAEFNVEIGGNTLDEDLFQYVFPILQNSLGAGIKLGFVSLFNNTEGFVMGDDEGEGDGLGFCDDDGAGNPTGAGGVFAEDIYVNAGA
jgi:hypothetical protein